MDNVMVVMPDSTRYWVLDGRDERTDTILCEQAKDQASGEQLRALKTKHPGDHILGRTGRDIAWKFEYERKFRDPEAHWVVLLCADVFHGRVVYGPDTFAECDAYTEYRKDDVRGELYFEIERLHYTPRSEIILRKG